MPTGDPSPENSYWGSFVSSLTTSSSAKFLVLSNVFAKKSFYFFIIAFAKLASSRVLDKSSPLDCCLSVSWFLIISTSLLSM